MWAAAFRVVWPPREWAARDKPPPYGVPSNSASNAAVRTCSVIPAARVPSLRPADSGLAATMAQWHARSSNSSAVRTNRETTRPRWWTGSTSPSGGAVGSSTAWPATATTTAQSPFAGHWARSMMTWTRRRATGSMASTTRSSSIGRRSAGQGGARVHSLNLAVDVLGAGGAEPCAGAGREPCASGGQNRGLTPMISRRSMAIAQLPEGPAGRRRRNSGVSLAKVLGGALGVTALYPRWPT